MNLDRELLEDPPAWLVRRVRQAVLVLAALGVFGFLIVGANRPANPYLVPAAGSPSNPSLAGFAAAQLVVTPGPGLHVPSRRLCSLVAATAAEQDQGLMNQTSLHGFDGMAFQFSQPTEVSFYMKDTLIPLTVAWFDTAGGFLTSVDMQPCPANETLCPTYSPGTKYQLALEVPAGRLTALGIGPGSSLHLGPPC